MGRLCTRRARLHEGLTLAARGALRQVSQCKDGRRRWGVMEPRSRKQQLFWRPVAAQFGARRADKRNNLHKRL
jgi:hypothetical protein